MAIGFRFEPLLKTKDQIGVNIYLTIPTQFDNNSSSVTGRGGAGFLSRSFSSAIVDLLGIMETYNVNRLATILRQFQTLETAMAMTAMASISRRGFDVPLPGELFERFRLECEDALHQCAEISTINCQPLIESMADQMRNSGSLTTGMAQMAIRQFITGIHTELAKWEFVRVAPRMGQYFEQDTLFGKEVYEYFPRSRQDVRDAGSCLAVALPTASVFHCMRVAEYGLRTLARKLKIVLTHKGSVQPIEYADWDKVITGIKNEITRVRTLPHGPKRQSQLEAYSDVADHCLFMKDIWRNTASHTRSRCSDTEALAALERVRDFMGFLAKHRKFR